ncbi:MAG: hypothetical protein JNJ78_15155 [Anaerolineae bacterium]|nr:hypothetical protein [Anaerolineae bacterium]
MPLDAKKLAQEFNQHIQALGANAKEAGIAQYEVEEFLNYLQRKPRKNIKNAVLDSSSVNEFIEYKYGFEIDRSEKEHTDNLYQFQKFIRGRWKHQRIRKYMIAALLGIPSLLLTISELGQAFGFTPSWWLPAPAATFVAQVFATPTPTPTITPTPTQTPLATPALNSSAYTSLKRVETQDYSIWLPESYRVLEISKIDNLLTAVNNMKMECGALKDILIDINDYFSQYFSGEQSVMSIDMSLLAYDEANSLTESGVCNPIGVTIMKASVNPEGAIGLEQLLSFPLAAAALIQSSEQDLERSMKDTAFPVNVIEVKVLDGSVENTIYLTAEGNYKTFGLHQLILVFTAKSNTGYFIVFMGQNILLDKDALLKSAKTFQPY